MGAHALGAAAYAARAAELAAPDRAADARREEICWQIEQTSEAVRSALRLLPVAGENASGPLGPGLLTVGALGEIVGELQAVLARTDNASVTKR